MGGDCVDDQEGQEEGAGVLRYRTRHPAIFVV